MGIRLAGFPVQQGAMDQLVRTLFDYRAVVRNGEWFVPANDPALRRGPRDMLRMHGRIELEPAKFADIAQRMADAVPPDFDEFRQHALGSVPTDVKIAGDLGLISDLLCALLEVVVASNKALPDTLEKKLLPLMYEKFGVRYVVPISLQSSVQQSYFSFAKLGCLVSQFGLERAKELTFDNNAFAGIEMSAGLELLNFVDAMIQSVPSVFTLPVRRHGCSWHFYGDGFRLYSYEYTSGLLEAFQSNSAPRYTSIGMPTLLGLYDMREQNIWRLLRLLVHGINRLFKYLNDHRNFVNADGALDFMAQIRAYAAINLMLADLACVNTSPEPHRRIVFSFSFLDKVANLRKNLGSHQAAEGALANELASLAQGKEIKRVVREGVASLYPDLANPLLRVVGTCYWQLHRELGRELSSNGLKERQRLSQFRRYRNLHHGAYLQNEGFDRLFATSRGSVPRALATLPYILTLGLMLDPQSFVSFRPQIKAG